MLARIVARQRFPVRPIRSVPCVQPIQRAVMPLVRPTMQCMSTAAKAGAGEERGNLRSIAYHFKRQRHLPYFLEYLMWVVFGSEALHLIWLKMEYKEYQEKTTHKIRLLEEIIQQIEQGQEFTESFKEEIRMVLLNGKRTADDGEEDEVDDEYLSKLIASGEAAQREHDENQWKTAVDAPPATSPEDPTPSKPESGDRKNAFFL